MTSKPIAMAVSCHAFNEAGTMCALSPNTNEIIIYVTEGSEDTEKWVPKYVLSEHGGQVSGLDWCSEKNGGFLVSCGHDRNAYVWKYDAGSDSWKPALVVLRINRAATSVKWSPNGKKFAVTSGAKCVPICHYEKRNDWYISKMIKKHKSTVLSVAWCPNNKFIVTGSSDNKCRILSAFIKNLDESADDGFGALWPNQHEFGETLAEFDHANAWVNSVAWSPNGFRIAFAGHGATMHFAQIQLGAPTSVETVTVPELPFLDIAFLSDNAVVAVGYNCNPTLFTAKGSETDPKWELKEQLDKGANEQKSGAVKSAFSDARKMWSDSTNKGIQAGGASGASKETVLSTRHQNTIMNIWIGKPGKLSTAGIDGRICFWDLAKLGVDVKGLKIVQ